MSAPVAIPHPHPLRIVPESSAPPESRNPSAITPLERIAQALERTADAITRVADRFDQDARQLEEMIANGRTLSDRSAQDIRNEELARRQKGVSR